MIGLELKRGLVLFSCLIVPAIAGYFGFQSSEAFAYEKTFRNSNIDYGNYSEHNIPQHLTSAMGVEDTGFFRVDNVTDYVGAMDQTLNRDPNSESEGYVLVEHYDKDFKYLSQTWIRRELPKYGGFYQGKDAYYFLFGKNNYEQDDTAEVWRIVKYDLSWNRVGSASLTGGETSAWDSIAVPSVDFYEADGFLYIDTNIEGYSDEGPEGEHHQWSYLIVVRTSDMTVVRHGDQQSVSHSMRQFILKDREGRVVVYEQGDGTPDRGALLVRFKQQDSARDEIGAATGVPEYYVGQVDHTNTWYYGFNEKDREEHDAWGNNETHATIGGFVETKDNYITAGSSTYQNKDESRSWPIHNTYITVTPKEDFTEASTRLTWLTSYEEEEGKVEMAGTPYIIKINDDRICVIWGVDLGYHETYDIQYVFIDSEGKLLSDIKTVKGHLSDCRPILSSISGEEKVYWTVNTDEDVFLYTLTADGKLSSKKATGYPEKMNVFPRKLDNKMDIYCNYIGDIPGGFGDAAGESMYKEMFTIYDTTHPDGEKALKFYRDFDTAGFGGNRIDGLWTNVRFTVKGFDPYYYGEHKYESHTISKAIRVNYDHYSGGGRDVCWYDYCDGAIGYTLYRKIGNGSYKIIKSYKNKGKKRYWKYVDKGVKKSQKVSYRVIAYTKTKSGKKIYTSKIVKPELPLLKLGKDLKKIKTGNTYKLKVTNNIWKKKVYYSSSDKNVVRVSKTGKVTAVGVGTAIITAKAGRQVGYTVFNVTKLTRLPSQEKALKKFIKEAEAKGASMITDITDDTYYKYDNDGYLKYMLLYENGLQGKLDFNDFPRLKTLEIHGSPDITDVDVRKNTMLEYLLIENGEIDTIDVSQNKTLDYLGLSELPIKDVDIKNNTELTQLYLNALPMTNIDISANKKLKSIMWYDVNIAAPDVAMYSSLETFVMENCGINGNIDMGGHPSLKLVRLDDNPGLTSVNVRGCTSLERFMAKKAGITELDLTGCKSLKCFDQKNDMFGTKLSRVICSGCSALEELSISSEEIKELDVSGCTSLRTLGCKATNLKSIDVHDCSALQELDLGALKAGAITPGEYTGGITSIDLSGCKELTRLELSGNHIKSLDLTGLSRLNRLQVINCGIEKLTLDPAGYPVLQILETNINNFTEFIAPNLPHLKTAYFTDCNNLKTIDLSGSTELTKLSTNLPSQPIQSIILNAALQNAETSPLTRKNMDGIVSYR